MTAEIIEKDFWVCWTLKRLFTLPAPPAGLLFKGGTSLSKVFGVIERFSEDVDLSFNRAELGFGGDSDPLNAFSGKKRKQCLEALTETCQQVIREKLLPQLLAVFGDALGETSSWALELAEDDPDVQTAAVSLPGRQPVSPCRRTRLHPSHRAAGDWGTVRPLAGYRRDGHVLRGRRIPRRVQGSGMQGPRTGRGADVLGKGNDTAYVAPRSGGQENSGIASHGITTTWCGCISTNWERPQLRTPSCC